MILLALLFALVTFALAAIAMTFPGWLAGTISQCRSGLGESPRMLQPLMGQRRRAAVVRWGLAMGAGTLSLASLGSIRIDAQPILVSAGLVIAAVALFLGAQLSAYAIGWSQGRSRTAGRVLTHGG